MKHSEARLGPLEDLTLRVEPGEVIRVEVLDPGPWFAGDYWRPPRQIGHGWGLMLVDMLAKDWGVEVDDDRTKVWFELDPAEPREPRRRQAPLR